MATTDYQAAIDTNDVIMSYVAETVWGETPTTPGFKKIRLDSEGFSGSKSRTRPNEIDPSGQASAAITTKEESTGSLNFSVSAGTHNDLLAASLGSAWTTAVNFVSNVSADTVSLASGSDVNKVITLTATDGQFLSTNLLIKGQFVKVIGTGSSPYNFIGRINTDPTATVLVLDCCSGTVPTSKTAAEQGRTTIKGSCLRNGKTFDSFTFEKKLAAALFLRYAGAFATGGSLDVGVGDYLKGTLAFLNKSEAKDTVAVTGATYAEPPTGTIIDSVKGIGTVWRGVGSTTPSEIDAIVQKIGVKWNKEGAAAQYGMGTAAALGMRAGKQLVTGTISTYFKDFTLYTEYLDEAAGPISFYALDGLVTAAATKGYVITFCNATIMNPKIVAGGPGQDIMADFEIEGNPDVIGMFADNNVGKTIQIDYFG